MSNIAFSELAEDNVEGGAKPSKIEIAAPTSGSDIDLDCRNKS